MRPADADAALIWTKHVEVLRAGVRARKPDGADRVRREIRRLESELGPLVSTLAIQEAKSRAGHQVDLGRGAI